MLLTAQTKVKTAENQRVVRSIGKRYLIDRTMELSLAEASVFWPIYESYEKTGGHLSISYEVMINEYIKEYLL
jgi:hypothetical protein